MKPFDRYLLLFFGMAFWVVGTIWYEWRGTRVFETTSQRYWINFVITPVMSTVICFLILRWRAVPATELASAALLIALPGMFGEALILSRFATLMPRMRLETAGKYGAFLFATYGVFLTVAEAIAIRAVGK